MGIVRVAPLSVFNLEGGHIVTEFNVIFPVACKVALFIDKVAVPRLVIEETCSVPLVKEIDPEYEELSPDKIRVPELSRDKALFPEMFPDKFALPFLM